MSQDVCCEADGGLALRRLSPVLPLTPPSPPFSCQLSPVTLYPSDQHPISFQQGTDTPSLPSPLDIPNYLLFRTPPKQPLTMPGQCMGRTQKPLSMHPAWKAARLTLSGDSA